jgi:hypothetical protein
VRDAALGAGVALALAVLGWWQLAGTDGSVEAATPVLAAVLGTGLVALTFVTPWCAAGARWRLLGAVLAGTWAGAAITALSGWGAPNATSLGILAAYGALCCAWCGWLAGTAWGAAQWGWHRATAQALALGVGLCACTTPMYAEPLVAAAPAGWLRGWILTVVTGANPLLVTGGSILSWDVWHQPYLYGVSDVAAYGFPHAAWGWAALCYALLGAGGAGVGWWGRRRTAGAAAPSQD